MYSCYCWSISPSSITLLFLTKEKAVTSKSCFENELNFKKFAIPLKQLLVFVYCMCVCVELSPHENTELALSSWLQLVLISTNEMKYRKEHSERLCKLGSQVVQKCATDSFDHYLSELCHHSGIQKLEEQQFSLLNMLHVIQKCVCCDNWGNRLLEVFISVSVLLGFIWLQRLINYELLLSSCCSALRAILFFPCTCTL